MKLFELPKHENLSKYTNANLDATGERLVQDVRTLLHQLDVIRRRVFVLSVRDGVDEAVHKLLLRSKQPRFDEVHHAMICKGSSDK